MKSLPIKAVLWLFCLVMTIASCEEKHQLATNEFPPFRGKDTLSMTKEPVQNQNDTPIFHKGQYVYIHGVVKAYVKSVDKNSCSCSNDSQVWCYHLEVVSPDGSYGTYDIYDPNRLLLTKDVDSIRVIYDNSVVLHALNSMTEISNNFLEEDRLMRKEIREVVENDNMIINHSKIK